MSALYGRLWADRGIVTRSGSREIHARLEDWEHSVQITLYAGGHFVVSVGEKYNPDTVVCEGNLGEEN